MYQMTESPFGENVFKKLVKLVPVKDKRTLEIIWVIKNKSSLYKSSPAKYASHLIGH
jgi:secreted Zn-dependent insulinase-like peptidase